MPGPQTAARGKMVEGALRALATPPRMVRHARHMCGSVERRQKYDPCARRPSRHPLPAPQTNACDRQTRRPCHTKVSPSANPAPSHAPWPRRPQARLATPSGACQTWQVHARATSSAGPHAAHACARWAPRCLTAQATRRRRPRRAKPRKHWAQCTAVGVVGSLRVPTPGWQAPGCAAAAAAAAGSSHSCATDTTADKTGFTVFTRHDDARLAPGISNGAPCAVHSSEL